MPAGTDLAFNAYAIPVATVGTVLVFLGIAVAARDRGSLIGWLFLTMTTMVSLYLNGAAMSYAEPDPQISLRWARIAHVGVSFMPSAILWSTVAIIGQLRVRVGALIPATVISAAFAGLALFSDAFVRGNTLRFWGYYPQYGFSGFVFVLFFAAIMASILVFYAIELRKTVGIAQRRRLAGLIVAFAVGSFGAVDFLPALGIDTYAFGYIPIFAFVLIMAYVVLRYRLIDITPEVAASQILQTMDSAVVVTDTTGVIRVANGAAGTLLGQDVNRLVGQRLASVISLPSRWFTANDRVTSVVDYEMSLSVTGEERFVSVSVSPLADRKEMLLGRVFVAQDITQRKGAELELRKLALFDPLTGLPNRVLFFDRLNQMLELAKRNHYTLAILYMDLDKFKEVNDAWGHEAGDELLRQVADRMRAVTRSSDTVARMGGDEFIGVCGRITSAGDAEVVAEKLVKTLSSPFSLKNATVDIGVSIGISVFPDHATDGETLLAQADRAMYAIKSIARGGYKVYQSSVE